LEGFWLAHLTDAKTSLIGTALNLGMMQRIDVATSGKKNKSKLLRNRCPGIIEYVLSGLELLC